MTRTKQKAANALDSLEYVALAVSLVFIINEPIKAADVKGNRTVHCIGLLPSRGLLRNDGMTGN